MPNPNPPPTTDRWQRIAAVFGAALELPVAARAAFVARECQGDAALAREVEGMLRAHDSGAPLLLEEERRFRPSDPLLRASDLPPGHRVGPWRVERLVGQGGMGEVYRAERVDGAYRQVVALKVLRPGYRTAETVRRFRVERQVLARLVHPAIAPLLDGGTLEDGRPYLVLQYVDGIPITRYCADRQLALAARLRLFVQVARVVESAHSQLVIHRDLKPSNILIEADGTPRLLDFGIARLLDPNVEDSLVRQTRPEHRLLTPEHAAPEQLRGEPCDTRTDVYGLGVLLFELLTDRTPFTASRRTLAELERLILETPAPLPSSVVTERPRQRALRGDLDLIAQVALRKEPERRYSSAAALADDVERFLGGLPVRAQPDRLGYRARKYFLRNRALVIGGVLVAVLLVGFAVLATVQAQRARTARTQAEQERVAAERMVQILTGLFERANPRKMPGADTVQAAGLLDEAERRIEELEQDPGRQAVLWRAIGQLHAANGRYARAEPLLRRSVEAQWRLRGPDDPEAARTYHELALLVRSYRGATVAKPMLDSSVARLRRIQGDTGTDYRVALADLATSTARPEQARAALAELARVEEASPVVDSFALAGRLHAEATALLQQGRPEEAAERFQVVLGLLARRLPEGHPDRATVRNNLATAFTQSGAYLQAESLQRQALAEGERQAGAPDARAGAHERLAVTLANLGRFEEAEALERRALALYREGLAAGHPLIASAMRNLGLMIAPRGRVEEGLGWLDSAIAHRRAAGSTEQHEEVAYLRGQQVSLLLRLGRREEASVAAQLADSVLRSRYAPGMPRRNDAVAWVTIAAFARGQYDTVVARGAELLEENAGQPLARRPKLAQVTCLLGAALAARGDLTEARGHLDRGCPVHEAWGLADPLVTAWGKEARARLP